MNAVVRSAVLEMGQGSGGVVLEAEMRCERCCFCRGDTHVVAGKQVVVLQTLGVYLNAGGLRNSNVSSACASVLHSCSPRCISRMRRNVYAGQTSVPPRCGYVLYSSRVYPAHLL